MHIVENVKKKLFNLNLLKLLEKRKFNFIKVKLLCQFANLNVVH